MAYGVHVEFVVVPEREADFLDWKRREGEIQDRSPGFIKRSMSQNIEKPAIYYFTCYWESEDHWKAFTETDDFKTAIEESGVREAIATRYFNLVKEIF